MKDIEEALALLAAPCTDERFFQRALKALTLVSQCRWSAFCCPGKQANTQKIIAFCDNKQIIPKTSYTLEGSPCEYFYQENPKSKHLFFPAALANLFPHFELLNYINADSYRAEAILDQQGQVIGHILVMDPFPQSESVKSKEFFRLLAQRISTEYLRLIAQSESNKNNLSLSKTHLKKYITKQILMTNHLASLKLSIRHKEIPNQSTNISNPNLVKIIEERLVNNISKKDRLIHTNDNNFIIIMHLTPNVHISNQINFNRQLRKFSQRLTQILSTKIEIDTQLINIDVKINTEIIVSAEHYFTKLDRFL